MFILTFQLAIMKKIRLFYLTIAMLLSGISIATLDGLDTDV